MEQNPNIEALKQYTKQGLAYLIQCTNIPEEELFKICLEFWHFFTLDILEKTKSGLFKDTPTLTGDMTSDQLALLQQQRSMQTGGTPNLMTMLSNCS